MQTVKHTGCCKLQSLMFQTVSYGVSLQCNEICELSGDVCRVEGACTYFKLHYKLHKVIIHNQMHVSVKTKISVH